MPWIQGPKPCLCLTCTSSATLVRTGAGDTVNAPSPSLYIFSWCQTSCRASIRAASKKKGRCPPPLILVLMLHATPLPPDPRDHFEGWP